MSETHIHLLPCEECKRRESRLRETDRAVAQQVEGERLLLQRLREAEDAERRLDAYINLPGGWKERALTAEAERARLQQEIASLRAENWALNETLAGRMNVVPRRDQR